MAHPNLQLKGEAHHNVSKLMNKIRHFVALLALVLISTLSAIAQGWTIIPTGQESQILSRVGTNVTRFTTQYNLFSWPNGDAKDGVIFETLCVVTNTLKPITCKYAAPLYWDGDTGMYINSTEFRFLDGYIRFRPSVPVKPAVALDRYLFNFWDESNNWLTERVGQLNPIGGTNALILIRAQATGSFVQIDRKTSRGWAQNVGSIQPGETLVLQYPKFPGGKEIRGAFSLGGSAPTNTVALVVFPGVKKASWNPTWSPY